jgi:crotonobetainyl-CoA:carnitine CoA-transferase CaiB-like acyl-CoA transferase
VRDAGFLGDVADAGAVKSVTREDPHRGVDELPPPVDRPFPQGEQHNRLVQPLTGVTVADLSRYLPGPFASRELLRLGARVSKIEPPEGDPLRAAAPEWYGALNEGKDVLTWDARSDPAPRALLEADVVLDGFRPGVWERLGVELADTAILCSITGFGADGPHVRQAGHDLNYLGYAGVLADTAPAMPPIQIADLAAGGQGAVIEVLAALLERERTGRGARLVLSMTGGSHRFVLHRPESETIPRLLTGGVACYRIYETSDGRYLTVAALEPKFWQRLCELLDQPELASRAFEPELPELTALFRTRTLSQWLDVLEGEDTCVGPVSTRAEAATALE